MYDKIHYKLKKSKKKKKNPPCDAGGHRFDPWLGKIPHDVGDHVSAQWRDDRSPLALEPGSATRDAAAIRSPCAAAGK